MERTDAIYQDGVFKPLNPVSLPENQRVALEIEQVDTQGQMGAQKIAAWLEETDHLRNRVAAEHGILPDSTVDIAADRLR